MLQIVLLVIGLIITVTFVLVMAFVFIKPAPSGAFAELSRVNRSQQEVTPEIMRWSENLRGMRQTRYNNMPPCFEVDVFARQLYSQFPDDKKRLQHRIVLDVVSVMLCQRTDECGERSRLNDRLAQIIGSGGDVDSDRARQTVVAYIGSDVNTDTVTNTVIGRFVVASVDLLQKSMETLKDDPELSDEIKNSLEGYIHSFLSSQLSEIYRQCAS